MTAAGLLREVLREDVGWIRGAYHLEVGDDFRARRLLDPQAVGVQVPHLS